MIIEVVVTVDNELYAHADIDMNEASAWIESVWESVGDNKLVKAYVQGPAEDDNGKDTGETRDVLIWSNQ